MKRIRIIVLLALACLMCQYACAEEDMHLLESYIECSLVEYFGETGSGRPLVDIQAATTKDGVAIGETLYAWKNTRYPNSNYSDVLKSIANDHFGGELDGIYINDLSGEIRESELYGWGTNGRDAETCDELYLLRLSQPNGGSYWMDVLVALRWWQYGYEFSDCMVYANAPRVTAFDIELENEMKNNNSYYDDEYYDDEYYEDGDYCDFGIYMGEMYVVNCESWISLREEMSTSSRRLAKVPYGAKVSNIYYWTDEFAFCTYNGMDGFVLTEYLSFTKPQPKNQYSLQTSYGGTQTMRGLDGRRLAINDGRFELVYYKASSRLKDSARTYPVDNLFDGNYDNAWSDGVDGEGIGEKIWATWDVDSGAYEVQGIAIRNGYQKTEKIYTKNSRPSYIQININGSYFEARLLDYREGWQCVLFEEPVVFYGRVNMEITIEDVFAGRIYEDTCITELDLLVDKL